MVRRSQAGFAHILLILVIVVALGAVGYLTVTKRGSGGRSSHGADISNWKEGCKGDERIRLTHMPMDLADVQSITPYGLTAGAHVTPIDHLYFYPKAKERDASPVYAMADGYIKQIQPRTQSTDSGRAKPAEYRIVMQHSCQTITYYDLVTSLAPDIQKAWNNNSGGLNIPIKSGQVIGRIGGQSLDTAVYNLNLILPGFISPELYEAEPWKVHTDDFFEYFAEPYKSQMLAINVRKVPPYSGKIDYDQPGKLIGNWFLQGSNGYGGPTGEGVGKDGHGYWDGHLALFYYAVDGKTVSVSVGSFGADKQPTAFAVKGNAPDPADIGVANGVVKYELIQQPQGITADGSPPPRQQGPVHIQGVALFQVLDGEKLKVEFFAGKTATQVTSFTSAAQIYER